jgi:hypothetical protein
LDIYILTGDNKRTYNLSLGFSEIAMITDSIYSTEFMPEIYQSLGSMSRYKSANPATTMEGGKVKIPSAKAVSDVHGPQGRVLLSN